MIEMDDASMEDVDSADVRLVARKRRLLKKAPDAPKRFKSAYICFVMEKMDDVKKNLPRDIKVTETMKILANMWRELPVQARQEYEKIATADKSRYFEEMASYSGPMQVPNKRQKKPPGAPKRAMSAFLSFSQMMRPHIRAQCPNLKNTDISGVLAERWREANEDEKRPHLERELREREKYHEDMAKWKEDEIWRTQQKSGSHSANSVLSEAMCALSEVGGEDHKYGHSISSPTMWAAMSSVCDMDASPEFWETDHESEGGGNGGTGSLFGDAYDQDEDYQSDEEGGDNNCGPHDSFLSRSFADSHGNAEAQEKAKKGIAMQRRAHDSSNDSIHTMDQEGDEDSGSGGKSGDSQSGSARSTSWTSGETSEDRASVDTFRGVSPGGPHLAQMHAHSQGPKESGRSASVASRRSNSTNESSRGSRGSKASSSASSNTKRSKASLVGAGGSARSSSSSSSHSIPSNSSSQKELKGKASKKGGSSSGGSANSDWAVGPVQRYLQNKQLQGAQDRPLHAATSQQMNFHALPSPGGPPTAQQQQQQQQSADARQQQRQRRRDNERKRMNDVFQGELDDGCELLHEMPVPTDGPLTFPRANDHGQGSSSLPTSASTHSASARRASPARRSGDNPSAFVAGFGSDGAAPPSDGQSSTPPSTPPSSPSPDGAHRSELAELWPFDISIRSKNRHRGAKEGGAGGDEGESASDDKSSSSSEDFLLDLSMPSSMPPFVDASVSSRHSHSGGSESMGEKSARKSKSKNSKKKTMHLFSEGDLGCMDGMGLGEELVSGSQGHNRDHGVMARGDDIIAPMETAYLTDHATADLGDVFQVRRGRNVPPSGVAVSSGGGGGGGAIVHAAGAAAAGVRYDTTEYSSAPSKIDSMAPPSLSSGRGRGGGRGTGRGGGGAGGARATRGKVSEGPTSSCASSSSSSSSSSMHDEYQQMQDHSSLPKMASALSSFYREQYVGDLGGGDRSHLKAVVKDETMGTHPMHPHDNSHLYGGDATGLLGISAGSEGGGAGPRSEKPRGSQHGTSVHAVDAAAYYNAYTAGSYPNLWEMYGSSDGSRPKAEDGLLSKQQQQHYGFDSAFYHEPRIQAQAQPRHHSMSSSSSCEGAQDLDQGQEMYQTSLVEQLSQQQARWSELAPPGVAPFISPHYLPTSSSSTASGREPATSARNNRRSTTTSSSSSSTSQAPLSSSSVVQRPLREDNSTDGAMSFLGTSSAAKFRGAAGVGDETVSSDRDRPGSNLDAGIDGELGLGLGGGSGGDRVRGRERRSSSAPGQEAHVSVSQMDEGKYSHQARSSASSSSSFSSSSSSSLSSSSVALLDHRLRHDGSRSHAVQQAQACTRTLSLVYESGMYSHVDDWADGMQKLFDMGKMKPLGPVVISHPTMSMAMASAQNQQVDSVPSMGATGGGAHSSSSMGAPMRAGGGGAGGGRAGVADKGSAAGRGTAPRRARAPPPDPSKAK